MARDVMSVRLWLPQIRVAGVVVDVPERPGGVGPCGEADLAATAHGVRAVRRPAGTAM